VAHKKKHKKKKTKPEGTLTFIGAILSQAIGQILGDAVEVAADRLADVQEKASRAIKKKKREAVETAQAVAP
jgi:hypothetical protein